MRKLTKVALSIIAASTLFVGCNEASPKKEEVAKPTISEESLGLRKVDLYSEDTVTPDETKYGKGYAGSGHTINRAFQDAPPMIPHDTEGMLPITINNNQCTSCHMPEVASSMGATAIPVSHFTNFRPKHNYNGKKFTKSIDNMKNEIAIDEMKTLAGARFNCSQCHAPQSDTIAPANTFEAVFTSKDGAKKSSWKGSKLTEGLDTLMD
jgi:cytochrome c-type protein NapB